MYRNDSPIKKFFCVIRSHFLINNEGLNRRWYIHTREYCSAIRSYEILYMLELGWILKS